MKKSKNIPTPLLMTEEYWANSYFSVARYSGVVQIKNAQYVIVNKEGKDLWECTAEANKYGRKKAIEAGEPADLIWIDLQPHYKRLGRDRIIQLIKEGKTFEEITKIQ